MYSERLNQQIASIPSLTKKAKAVYEKYGALINRYRGGLPAGLACAFIALESGGNPNAVGDPSLGEFGLMQVAKNTENDFQVPANTRLSVEGNIFLGSLELGAEATRLNLRYPAYIQSGSLDQWLLARLVFALGRYGLTSRLDKAITAGYVSPGRTYSGLLKFITKTEPDTKAWLRIASVGAVQVPVSKNVKPLEYPGAPEAVAPPAGVRYTLPKDLSGKMSNKSPILLVAALGAAFFLAR